MCQIAGKTGVEGVVCANGRRGTGTREDRQEFNGVIDTPHEYRSGLNGVGFVEAEVAEAATGVRVVVLTVAGNGRRGRDGSRAGRLEAGQRRNPLRRATGADAGRDNQRHTGRQDQESEAAAQRGFSEEVAIRLDTPAGAVNSHITQTAPSPLGITPPRPPFPLSELLP